MVAITLTICFETPYWIGVFEQIDSGKLRVCKVIFGAEPKDYQVYEWLLTHYDSLNFSKPISIETKKTKKLNPKRIQRQISQELSKVGLSTKSQDAIKKQYEESKIEQKKRRKLAQELKKEKVFDLKQQKKKEKHKGH